MRNKIINLFFIIKAIAALFLAIFCACSLSAQTTINSDGVSVDNGAPNVVTFQFPTSEQSNIVMIRFGCSQSPLHEVFIYERQPNGQIVTYPFTTPPGLPCNEAFGNGGFSFTGSLQEDITLTTADHTVTIKQSTAWTAAKVSCGRSGYCWRETGGSSQIVVQ